MTHTPMVCPSENSISGISGLRWGRRVFEWVCCPGQAARASTQFTCNSAFASNLVQILRAVRLINSGSLRSGSNNSRKDMSQVVVRLHGHWELQP